MNPLKSPSWIAAAVFAAAAGPADAVVIASTHFNGRTLGTSLVTNDTASGLTWVTNGVSSPGNLSARQWGGAGQALFNSTSLTQNMFAPALNVGNAGDDNTRSWTTTIGLTVLPGQLVSLETVSFDYWAISGTGIQNPARDSDFVVSLFGPDAVFLDSVSAEDISNGATAGVGTPVLLTFGAPIALTEAGTYTLRIRAGDIDNSATGNHTAIDNLSINGTVTPVPEPSSSLWALAAAALMFRRRR